MSTLLRGGRVLAPDGTTTGPADVLVEGGVVAAVGAPVGRRARAGVRIIDCSGATVMPGLVDAHVHLAMAGAVEADTTDDERLRRVADNARRLLRAGVTTARDVGGPADVLIAQRERCADDPTAGPQLLVCGEAIACVDGHGTEFSGATIAREVDGPQAARAAVRRLSRIGVDGVKVMLNGADDALELGEAELTAIVEEARAARLPVAAHASNARAVALAVGARVTSIEHGNDLDDALAAEMAAAGIALVATTHIYRQGAGCTTEHGAVGADLDEPYAIDPITAFPPDVQAQVRRILAHRVAGHERALPAAVRAGVRIVLGTDAVRGPADRAVDELLALTELGLAPSAALHAATTAGAELLGLPDRGRVAVGARADLLVVDGRPDDDLRTLRRPVLVMRAGQVVDDARCGDPIGEQFQ